MITVVKADLTRPAMAHAVVFLLNDYASDPMGGAIPLPDSVKQQLIPQLLKRPFFHCFLAFEGEQPIGLINLLEGFSTFSAKPLLNIHDVTVVATHRGRGVADLLFAAAEAFAMEMGCVKLTLEVLEGNEPARRAYTRLGFRPYQLDPEAGVAQFWEKKLC